MKLRYIVLLAIVMFLFVLRTRPARFLGTPRPAAPVISQGVRITGFYPAAAKLARGDKTVLCYGVDGARSVRLSPPVEQVWPAFTRCFEVAPAQTTKYTLIAEDAQGQSVSESAMIEVGPAAPKILEVSVNKLRVSPGEAVTLCFKARNATHFDVGGLKPVLVSTGSGMGEVVPTPERGCFADHPRTTRTYLVKVSGPGGEDSEKVTVTVR